jgi:hypothetical protein
MNPSLVNGFHAAIRVSVPEPASVTMCALGLALVGAMTRVRRARKSRVVEVG